MGVRLDIQDWDTIGHGIHLILNIQPSGEYLGEAFHRAGGVSAILGELIHAVRSIPKRLRLQGRPSEKTAASVAA